MFEKAAKWQTKMAICDSKRHVSKCLKYLLQHKTPNVHQHFVEIIWTEELTKQFHGRD